MKRITLIAVSFACGLLATERPRLAQDRDTSSSWFMGNVNLLLLGRDDVASSKFEEYRDDPEGHLDARSSLAGSQKGIDFALYGQKVGLADQRYSGWMKTTGLAS